MSKGNLLFGQARGKVGDLVLTRLAGEQVARARNRAPKNPRTTKQMVQRAMMATLVEFYTRGTRNLFKFAFESKRPGESDYNAFVRANMGRVPVMSKLTIKDDRFVHGRYVMSQGSLPAPVFGYNDEFDSGVLESAAVPAAGATLTIGDMSKAIIARNGLLDGDIITICAIYDPQADISTDMADAMSEGATTHNCSTTKWTVSQFTLDVKSTALVSTLNIFDVDSIESGSTYLPFKAGSIGVGPNTGSAPSMLTVIASRNVGSSLLVSTSELKLSDRLVSADEYADSDEWKTYVAKHYMEATSFEAKPEDILKGSISKN